MAETEDSNAPLSPETPIELTVLDILNILTREHLKLILVSYEYFCGRHNMDANIQWNLSSCLDLKKKEISRFHQLKSQYFAIWKKEPENAEVMKKGKGKTSSSTDEENVHSEREKSNSTPYGVLKRIQEFHATNILWFTLAIKYVNAGFNKFRYDQCPNVHLDQTIMERVEAPNRVLQETMLSLKITNEEMIKEGPKEKDIRILNFRIMQTDSLVEFHINIPKIHEFDKEKIIKRCAEKDDGVGIYVNNHNGKNYVFEISNFAYKINPTVKLNIFKDSLVIYTKKKNMETWRQLFNYNVQTKVLWEKEMESVLNLLSPDAREQMEPMDFLWNVALILVNCKSDLLNLPHDLNHVNKSFKTFEEMIIYYKMMISLNPDLKALFYIIGGAFLYRNLLESSSPSKKDLSEFVKETVKEITEMMELYVKNYEEGHNLCLKQKFEEAIPFFDKASSFCPFPNLHVMRGTYLFKTGRYREALMDCIFGLRNIGPYQGIEAFLKLINYNIISGNIIQPMNVAISYEFNNKQMDEHQIQGVKDLRRKGLQILNNIFKSFLLIFQKKYKDAMLCLEKAEEEIILKSDFTSVILLLLYFMHKNYEKVIILGKKILGNYNSCRDLVFYLLGMSSYYMKNLDAAVHYIELCGSKELTKFKELRFLVNKTEYLVEHEKLEKDLRRGGYLVAEALEDYYKRAMQLAKGNDALLGFIWAKFGVFNYLWGKNKEAAEYLTYSMDITGDDKCLLMIRSAAYLKLGLINESKRDRNASINLSHETEKDRNVAQES